MSGLIRELPGYLHATIMVLTLVNCLLWIDGPNNFPAGRLLAMAAGVTSATYCLVWAHAGFDWTAARDVIVESSSNLLVLGLVIGLELWAMGLIITHRLAKPGSDVSLFGHVSKPSRATIRFAYRVIERADRHELLNVEQAKISQAFIDKFREAERKGEVRGRDGRKRRLLRSLHDAAERTVRAAEVDAQVPAREDR